MIRANRLVNVDSRRRFIVSSVRSTSKQRACSFCSPSEAEDGRTLRAPVLIVRVCTCTHTNTHTNTRVYVCERAYEHVYTRRVV